MDCFFFNRTWLYVRFVALWLCCLWLLFVNIRVTAVFFVCGFEYAVLVILNVSMMLKYAIHMYELRRKQENQWEGKTVLLLYLDLIVDMYKLFIYCVFFVLIVASSYVFPFYLIRSLWSSYTSLRKRIRDIGRYRSVMNSLLGYPGITQADLDHDALCIICREDMVLSDPPTSRVLPCKHAFHSSCLRSWLGNRQTCPTCNFDLLSGDDSGAGRNGNNVNPNGRRNRRNNNNNRRGRGTGRDRRTSSSSSSSSTNSASKFARREREKARDLAVSQAAQATRTLSDLVEQTMISRGNGVAVSGAQSSPSSSLFGGGGTSVVSPRQQVGTLGSPDGDGGETDFCARLTRMESSLSMLTHSMEGLQRDVARLVRRTGNESEERADHVPLSPLGISH